MNWEVAGVLIEGAGAMAVVVSLIYLARQMQQGTELGRASVPYRPTKQLSWPHIEPCRERRPQRAVPAWLKRSGRVVMVGTTPVLPGCWVSSSSSTKFSLRGARPGLTSEDDMASWGHFIGSLLKEPGGARYWREARGLFKAEVTDSLDAAMQRTRPLSEIMPRVFESGQATD